MEFVRENLKNYLTDWLFWSLTQRFFITRGMSCINYNFSFLMRYLRKQNHLNSLTKLKKIIGYVATALSGRIKKTWPPSYCITPPLYLFIYCFIQSYRSFVSSIDSPIRWTRLFHCQYAFLHLYAIESVISASTICFVVRLKTKYYVEKIFRF